MMSLMSVIRVGIDFLSLVNRFFTVWSSSPSVSHFFSLRRSSIDSIFEFIMRLPVARVLGHGFG